MLCYVCWNYIFMRAGSTSRVSPELCSAKNELREREGQKREAEGDREHVLRQGIGLLTAQGSTRSRAGMEKSCKKIPTSQRQGFRGRVGKLPKGGA